MPAPYWVSYPDMVLLADGIPVMPYAGPEQGYKLTPAQLEAAITPKTRLFILNSPSNPTGAAYSAAELRALGDVLVKHPQVVICTDDMYEHIYWAKEPFVSLAQVCPELYDARRDDEWRVEGVCDDGLAHRLLRRTDRDRHRDVHDSESEHLESLLDRAEGGDHRAERRSGLRARDEQVVQGAPRLRGRGPEQAARASPASKARARSTRSRTWKRR